MVKKLVFIVAVLLVLGLFIAPQFTKDAVKITGKATVDTTKELVNEARESPEIQEHVQGLKDKANETVQEVLD